MNEERKKILEMLETKKITAEEAAKLLDAVDSRASDSVPAKGKKKLRIRVFEGGSGKAKVNINIPLSLAKLVMKFVPEHATAKINDRDIDIKAILSEIENMEGERVDIINVEDGEERVEIFLE